MADAPTRRCFVLSPIGAEGSEVREHADDVFEFIIEPAMKELGIHAYRSDHNLVAGRVTEQMFASLLGDDLCVAVLTFENPNVFYELAIAQSAARPTVILIEKGKTLPFDLRDVRAIEYDFRPRPLRDGVYVRQLVEHVRSIELAGWRATVPFGPSLSPLGLDCRPLQVFDGITDFGSEERWLDLLSDAREQFWALGISMSRWTSRRFRTLLTQKAKAGCDVRIMLMHPENPGLAGMINEIDRLGTVAEVVDAIVRVERALGQLAQNNDRFQVKSIRHGTPHHQLVLTDRLAIAQLYFYARTSDAPILLLERPSPITEAFDGEFAVFWRNN